MAMRTQDRRCASGVNGSDPERPYRSSWLVLVAFAFVVATLTDRSVTARDAPNIVIMMVDDLGWNHIGVDGATLGTHEPAYVTPNLAEFAAGGMSFTHAYAQPNCAPTRAAMLSGQYSARIHNDVYVVGSLNRFGGGGIKKNAAKFKGPPQSEDVAPDAITMAEALRESGYATAHIGKYHVGGHRGESTLPEKAGFDINLGGFRQGHQPVCFASMINSKWGFKGLGRGDFDRFAEPYDQAYLKTRGLPSSLAGTPKHVSDALGDAMEETVKKLADGSSPFYLQFHPYAVHGPVRSRPDLKAKATGLSASQANYVGFISGVDENLGRLMACLEDPNRDGDSSDSVLENTLVIFTSDNGGTHASNAPLKGKKGMFTDGGLRVPLIASWQGKIPEGTVTNRLVHCVDYYPTLLELAGSGYQPPVQDHPLDGVSFAKTLLGNEKATRGSPIGYLFPGYLDVRARPCVVMIDDVDGQRFKLVYDYESGRYSLFCLSKDPGEERDCFSDAPDVAKRLSVAMNQWLSQQHPTWQPKYPIQRSSGVSAGPPPGLSE
ncbi:MAG: sulfatase-like hydrolase/transferase [Planctomycetota bacterium]